MKGSRFFVLLGICGALAIALLGLAWWLQAISETYTEVTNRISWREDDYLWVLSIVPAFMAVLFAAWELREQSRRKFGNEDTVASLIVGQSARLRAVRGSLLIVAITLLIISLAGPRYGSRTRVLRKRGVDVVIALDFSKSMLARDVSPDRINRAKRELTRFIRELDGDRVGVVAFAGETMEFPMTIDYSAVELFLRDLGPYDMPVGGTAIGRAIISSKRLLERSRTPADDEEQASTADQVVVLFTDGEDHEGDPLEAAQELADANIRLYVVGIGSRSGEPIPTYAPDGTWTGYLRDDAGDPVTTSLSAESEGILEQMAERTGGKYFRARRGDVGVDQIRAEMRRMKQAEQRSRRIEIQEDRYALVLAPAFLLLVLEGILPAAFVAHRHRRRAPKRVPRPGSPIRAKHAKKEEE